MSGVGEASGAPNPLASALHAGVENISQNQTVTFTKFVRLILPLDGYAFWVKAESVSGSALYNAALLNRTAYNQPSRVVAAAPTIVAKGSLHYSTDTRQDEVNTYSVNRVVFTSEQEITDLNEVGPTVIYIGVIDNIRFAFSTRGSFYRQAGLWHYVGAAVYSDMETQVVEDPRSLDTRNVVVSNSLPLWLALNNYEPFYGFGNNIPLFPSFLVPGNLAPAFGSVHIDPQGTRALSAAPLLGPTSTHSQLCADKVRVTLFGTRNFNALDFVDCVLQRSADYGEFGIMNQPVVRDEKRTQSELNTIAQKKTIEFEISYNQSRVNDVARQMILQAIPSFSVGY